MNPQFLHYSFVLKPKIVKKLSFNLGSYTQSLLLRTLLTLCIALCAVSCLVPDDRGNCDQIVLEEGSGTLRRSENEPTTYNFEFKYETGYYSSISCATRRFTFNQYTEPSYILYGTSKLLGNENDRVILKEGEFPENSFYGGTTKALSYEIIHQFDFDDLPEKTDFLLQIYLIRNIHPSREKFEIEFSSDDTVSQSVVYEPNNITLNSATSITSPIPTVNGLATPYYFQIDNAHEVPDVITIDENTGVISVPDSFASEFGNKSYVIDLGVYFDDFEGIFQQDSAYTIILDVEGNDQSITYNPNHLEITSATPTSTPPPIITGMGTPPYDEFYLVDVGDLPLGEIIIDRETGVITTTAELATEIGSRTYSINVGIRKGNERYNEYGAYTITTNLSAEQSIVYNPNTTTLTTAIDTSSPAPTVTGMGDPPFTFSLANGGDLPSPGITIDSQTGVIATTAAFASTFGNNTYNFNVYVTNGTRDYTQNNAYTLNVALEGGEMPSNLVYSPNTITQGNAITVSSPMPTVSGNSPITYSIENSNIPASATALSIDPNTGIISATAELFTEIGPGTYTIDVGVTNAAGSVTFPAAFIIEVPLVSVVYNPNAISITTVTGITSPTPTVTGLGSPPFTSAIANADDLNRPISIDPNSGVISATDILALEFGNNTHMAHVSVTNGTGITYTQNNAYTIIVNR